MAGIEITTKIYDDKIVQDLNSSFDIGRLATRVVYTQEEEFKKALRSIGWVELKNLYVEDGKIKELKC